jgi:hypothetical protein
MDKPGNAIVCSEEGAWIVGDLTADSKSILSEGVLFVVEEGTELATSSRDYIASLLKNNINRIIQAYREAKASSLLN